MFEIGFTFFILLFFIFPVAGAAAGMGVWTCYLIYRKMLLLNRQPPQWKKIVWLHLLTGGANTLLSIVMGLLLSLTVYFLIHESTRLLFFNFLFCFLISFRWFDFFHIVYRRMIMKMKKITHPPREDSVFVMMAGQRAGTGMGLGMNTISLDSGYLYWDGYQLVFDGVISRQVFSRQNVLSVEKVSSEKIKIIPVQQNNNETTEARVIIIRQLFYPFKSKELRDSWFNRLTDIQQPSQPDLAAGTWTITPDSAT